MRRIVLISCGSQKLPHRAKARDMYTSTLFKRSMQYAEKLQPDDIFILSAKHGLLPLHQEIEPYEKTLNDMSPTEIRKWAEQVLEQLTAVSSLEHAAFIFLAGEKYRKYLLPRIKKADVPLRGLRIGQQIQALGKLCDE